MAHPLYQEAALGTVAIVLAWGLALWVFAAAPRRPMNRLLAAILYLEGALQWIAWDDPMWGTAAVRLAGFFLAPALWALPIAYLFLLARLDTRATAWLRTRTARRSLVALLVASLALFLPLAFLILVRGAVPTPLAPFFFITVLGYLFVGLVSVYALVAAVLAWRRATDRLARDAARTFVIAFGVRDLLFGLGILSSFVPTGIHLVDAGGWSLPIFATIAFVPLLTFGLLRDRVVGIDTRGRRPLGQGVVLFLLLGSYVLAWQAFAIWFTPHLGDTVTFLSMVLLFLLLFATYRGWERRRLGRGVEADVPVVAPSLDVGMRLAERYRVLHELGHGAHGVAWLAEDITLGRTVVIKSLDARRHDPYPEAQRLAAVQHPHVVQVHDLLRARDTVHLVLEHVPVGTLKTRLQGGSISEPTVVALGTHLLGALGAAHGAGLVHRDVKPSNIFLAADDTIRLGDFGVARDLSADETIMPGAVHPPTGTVPYMSPEQAGGRKVGPASDLYSAALVLYEALAGSAYWAPEPGESTVELRQRIARRRARPDAMERVPPASRRFFARALHPEPGERYPDAATMADAWIGCWGDEPVVAHPVGDPSPVQEQQARPADADEVA